MTYQIIVVIEIALFCHFFCGDGGGGGGGDEDLW